MSKKPYGQPIEHGALFKCSAGYARYGISFIILALSCCYFIFHIHIVEIFICASINPFLTPIVSHMGGTSASGKYRTNNVLDLLRLIDQFGVPTHFFHINSLERFCCRCWQTKNNLQKILLENPLQVVYSLL